MLYHRPSTQVTNTDPENREESSLPIAPYLAGSMLAAGFAIILNWK